jgi:hypothetical protein
METERFRVRQRPKEIHFCMITVYVTDCYTRQKAIRQKPRLGRHGVYGSLSLGHPLGTRLLGLKI